MTAPSMGPGWPQRYPELLPFVPLSLAIWRDGVFSTEDHETFRDHLARLGHLPEAARSELERWMDPASPPDRRSVVLLRRIVRDATRDAAYPDSLVHLGLELVEGHDAAGLWTDEAMAALEALQDALGFRRTKFAHLSVITNPDGSKMSKRDKDKVLRKTVRERKIETPPEGTVPIDGGEAQMSPREDV